MESEHSMAREDRDGSGTVMEFMACISCLFGESNWRVREPEKQRFSILANTGFYKWIKDVMVVAFLPIVHNSGSHERWVPRQG
jgi:hypothetical protein